MDMPAIDGAGDASGDASHKDPTTGEDQYVTMIGKKSGNVSRVGVFLDFVRLTTRTEGPLFLDFVARRLTTRAEGPHGAHVRRAKRNRIGHSCSWMLIPLSCRYATVDKSKFNTADRPARPPRPARPSHPGADASVEDLGSGYVKIDFGDAANGAGGGVQHRQIHGKNYDTRLHAPRGGQFGFARSPARATRHTPMGVHRTWRWAGETKKDTHLKHTIAPLAYV